MSPRTRSVKIETQITAAGELFGKRLRELRDRSGLTQAAVADAMGVPQTHVSALERGLILPNLLTVIRLAVALDCKVTALTSVFDKTNLAAILPK
jgi:transcriptional regulator with XRE-family HTH domain